MLSPMGEKIHPKCTLEKIKPLQRPGMSSTDADHLCSGGRWTSVDPQPCWKMSVRLKSKRQFQRLILEVLSRHCSPGGQTLQTCTQTEMCQPSQGEQERLYPCHKASVSEAQGCQSVSATLKISGQNFKVQETVKKLLDILFQREEPLGILRNVLWAMRCH